MKANSDLISRSCFVDPVVFCVWDGDICSNFVYKKCTTGTEIIIRYFTGSELGVACLLRRHFNWFDGALWFDEIPHGADTKKTVFSLCGDDTILNVEVSIVLAVLRPTKS